MAFEDFNSLSLGNLNTQAGWSGDTLFQVENSVTQEGAQAVSWVQNGAPNNDKYIDKPFGSVIADGNITVYLRATIANVESWIELREGSNPIAVFRVYDTHFASRQGGGFNNVCSASIDNNWVKIKTEWRTSDKKFQYTIDSGAGNGFQTVDGTFTTGIDSIRLYCYGGNACTVYVDNISASFDNPSTSVTGTASLTIPHLVIAGATDGALLTIPLVQTTGYSTQQGNFATMVLPNWSISAKDADKGEADITTPKWSVSGDIVSQILYTTDITFKRLVVTGDVLGSSVGTATLTMPKYTVSGLFGHTSDVSLPTWQVSSESQTGQIVSGDLECEAISLSAIGSTAQLGTATLTMRRLKVSAICAQGSAAVYQETIRALQVSGVCDVGRIGTSQCTMKHPTVVSTGYPTAVMIGALTMPKFVTRATMRVR